MSGDQFSSMKPTGLTTEEALRRLHGDLSNELNKFEEKVFKEDRKWLSKGTWKWDAFHHNSPYSTLRWTSGFMLLLEAVFLLICYGVKEDPRYDRLAIEAFIIVTLTLLNMFLVSWENRLRHREIQKKMKNTLEYLDECARTCKWETSNYPQLNMPLSPCITLQWTYRDGNLVNLHWSLLVQGDVIALKPGQIIPAHCIPVDDPSGQELHFGERYVPPSETTYDKIFSGPRVRNPLNVKKYIVLETPFIKNLKLALNKCKDRPLSIFDNERHVIASYWLEKVLVPLILISFFFINVLRYLYLSQSVGHWTEMLILLQVQAVMPFLPLAFPICWLLLNAYGMARLQTIFQISRQVELDPFDEFGEVLPTIPGCELKWKVLRKQMFQILLGHCSSPVRTANLLHVLGGVTALCCVDKKGILSWPNPTAEKVFFLRTPNFTPDSSKTSSAFQSALSLTKHKTTGSTGEDATFQNPSNQPLQNKFKGRHIQCNSGYNQLESIVEVLDLTHDNQVAFGLQFDDPKWKKYINSLKPLGLAILLNTCNPQTQDHYTNFSSHITYEALHNEDVVPVVNRREAGVTADFPNSHSRCLCELARQIGFTDQAMDIFQLQQQLSTFRPVPDLVRKDKFAKSLSFTKLKFPFPHMVSVVVKENSTGMLQLMSQGTGDIILDSCSDFWDGQDLCPLTEHDRKKILDFYHRTSLTAYCTAFAYRPITTAISVKFNNVYLELPADSSHLYPNIRSPTPTRSWDLQSLDSRMKHIITQFFSTDSLIGREEKEDNAAADVDTCFEVQCNQIFIGMVTMQYQARADVVHLIEQLDKACIRFVHFSKENELRSRVFSEKMGLESGWNCHISLLMERNRSESGNSSCPQGTTQNPSKTSGSGLIKKLTSIDELLQIGDCHKSPKMRHPLECSRLLSHSAPSAINLEVATVKFEDEISMYDVTATETSSVVSTNKLPPRVPSGSNTHHHSEEKLSNDDLDSNDMDLEESLLGRDDSFNKMDDANASRSPSHITESTEQSAPVGFDMSNRAKLPKGIEKIRPHLENIDNVPLLVSLFTDCTPDATREMIKIMQEYGEVVCCMGSAANCHNMAIFLQANASIAIEPLYPQLCMKQPVFTHPPSDNGPAPIEISHQLNSLASSLNFSREDPVSIYHLIMEARHFTISMRNCFQFMLACCLSLTLLQILGCILLLPPILNSSQLLWLVCIIIPFLSVSLVGSPVNHQIMTLATGKNVHVIDKDVVIYFIVCNGAKFIPSIIVCVLCFGVTLFTFCEKLTEEKGECHLFFGNTNFSKPYEWNGWGNAYRVSLYTCQNVAAFLLVVYFVFISASFVHRGHQLWNLSPLKNKLWFSVCATVLVFQVIYCAVDIAIRSSQSVNPSPSITELPLTVWIIAFIWPFCLILLNEMVKRHEIRANVRYQKRARLEFGTKLGMNSPF